MPAGSIATMRSGRKTILLSLHITSGTRRRLRKRGPNAMQGPPGIGGGAHFCGAWARFLVLSHPVCCTVAAAAGSLLQQQPDTRSGQHPAVPFFIRAYTGHAYPCPVLSYRSTGLQTRRSGYRARSFSS